MLDESMTGASRRPGTVVTGPRPGAAVPPAWGPATFGFTPRATAPPYAPHGPVSGSWAPPVPPVGMAPAGMAPAGMAPAGMAPRSAVSPPLRRPRWPWVLGAVAAVTVLIAIIASLGSSTTVSGTVTLYATSSLAPGTSCEGANWYSWVTPGTSISVFDKSGDLVATGALGNGVAQSTGRYSSYSDTCVFSYSVPDVPSSDHYTVKVGTGSGSGVPFSADQVDGHADIAIGYPS